MDDEERTLLIRRGNELFNKGDLKNALKIFLATDYKDGIIRVADVLYFDKNDKISALKLYKKAGYRKVVDSFAEKAAMIIRMFLQEDKRKRISEEEMIKAFVSEFKPEKIERNLKEKEDKMEKKNDSDER